jgi:hypothetical protein
MLAYGRDELPLIRNGPDDPTVPAPDERDLVPTEWLPCKRGSVPGNRSLHVA